MKKFVLGMLVGATITVAALAGVATTIKETVIDSIEEKEDMIEENRKGATRKCVTRQKTAVTLR